MSTNTPSTIYFVRHGQKLPHKNDPGLTEVGKSQAQSTGTFLKQFPITRIIASPFKRTQETAEQIAHQLKLEVEINEALIERMEWPDETVTKQQFSQEWVKATNNRTYVPQWGTSSEETGKRIADLILHHADSGEHILIVSHGGAIVDSLRTMFGDAPLESLKRTYDEGADFLMLNCAITQVILDSPPQLKLLHFTDHLQQVSE